MLFDEEQEVSDLSTNESCSYKREYVKDFRYERQLLSAL